MNNKNLNNEQFSILFMVLKRCACMHALHIADSGFDRLRLFASVRAGCCCLCLCVFAHY